MVKSAERVLDILELLQAENQPMTLESIHRQTKISKTTVYRVLKTFVHRGYLSQSPDGLYRHFEAIAEAVDLPMVLYNVPGRTVADLLPETVLRLAQLPGIVGIKEATGNIDRAGWLIKHAPKGFSIYSGDDGTAIALMLLGGHGNVSVTANVAPRAMHDLCMAAIEGNARAATALHFKLLPLHRHLFAEPSPAPTKWAMAKLGLCGDALRLPMVPLSAGGQTLVEQALRDAGLL